GVGAVIRTPALKCGNSARWSRHGTARTPAGRCCGSPAPAGRRSSPGCAPAFSIVPNPDSTYVAAGRFTEPAVTFFLARHSSITGVVVVLPVGADRRRIGGRRPDAATTRHRRCGGPGDPGRDGGGDYPRHRRRRPRAHRPGRPSVRTGDGRGAPP